MKYILDTNVYLQACRSAEKRAQFQTAFYPLIPATFLSAVVAYELSVNARDQRTGQLIRELIHPMARSGRLVAPTFDDWTRASEIMTGIVTREKGWRSKLPSLLNDVLISLCARRVGATLLTYNKKDFMLIRRHADFSLRILFSL